MLFYFLLILGLLTMSFALYSFEGVVFQKLGALGILLTSYTAGYALSGYWQIGVFCAGIWLFLPWFEILTHTRQLRLPSEKRLRLKNPPSEENFPALDELTSEIEEEGFEQMENVGWNWEDHQQFFRLFLKNDERHQAAICLIDQEDIAFYYLSISSRAADGTVWTTWNYPFVYSLKVAPNLKINRCRNSESFLQLLESHRAFLSAHAVLVENLVTPNPDKIQSEIESDLRKQIDHNISTGVLMPAGEGEVRYSWRGLFFLWIQFLRDLLRFS